MRQTRESYLRKERDCYLPITESLMMVSRKDFIVYYFYAVKRKWCIIWHYYLTRAFFSVFARVEDDLNFHPAVHPCNTYHDKSNLSRMLKIRDNFSLIFSFIAPLLIANQGSMLLFQSLNGNSKRDTHTQFGHFTGFPNLFSISSRYLSL